MIHEVMIEREPRRRHNVQVIYVDGRRTSVRLEPVIWKALKGIASQREINLHELVSAINRGRVTSGLTSAIRAYVVTYLIAQAPHEALPTHLFRRPPAERSIVLSKKRCR